MITEAVDGEIVHRDSLGSHPAIRPGDINWMTEAVLDAGLAGAGIIRLFSFHIGDAVKDGGLTILLEGFEPPPLPVNIVYLGGGLQPLKVRAFVDFAAPQLKARLASDLASRSP
jgi:DNA-binding transcriptional LysR family regulator